MRHSFKAFLIAGLILLVGEGTLRTGQLFFPSLKNANLYFDWSSESAYWRYRSEWTQEVESPQKRVFDSVLGWDSSPSNISATASVILMGDNFLKDLPVDSLEKDIGGKVLNLSVSGYGWDQIALKAKQLVPRYKSAKFLIGLSSVGLDRSVLSYRTGPKPYYEVSDMGLQLRGVPLSNLHSTYTPWWESFFVHLLIRQTELLFCKNEMETFRFREKKKSLNKKIIEELAIFFKKQNVAFSGIGFFSKAEVNYSGWREVFMKKQIAPLFPLFLSSKEVLKDAGTSEYEAEGTLSVEAKTYLIKQWMESMRASSVI